MPRGFQTWIHLSDTAVARLVELIIKHLTLDYVKQAGRLGRDSAPAFPTAGVRQIIKQGVFVRLVCGEIMDPPFVSTLASKDHQKREANRMAELCVSFAWSRGIMLLINNVEHFPEDAKVWFHKLAAFAAWKNLPPKSALPASTTTAANAADAASSATAATLALDDTDTGLQTVSTGLRHSTMTPYKILSPAKSAADSGARPCSENCTMFLKAAKGLCTFSELGEHVQKTGCEYTVLARGHLKRHSYTFLQSAPGCVSALDKTLALLNMASGTSTSAAPTQVLKSAPPTLEETSNATKKARLNSGAASPVALRDNDDDEGGERRRKAKGKGKAKEVSDKENDDDFWIMVSRS